jgi:hypothetical protein
VILNCLVPEVPPPRPEFATEILYVPLALLPLARVILIVIRVEPSTVLEFTVIFVVPTFTVLAPETNLVPVKTTFRVLSLEPLVGEILLKVGSGLFIEIDRLLVAEVLTLSVLQRYPNIYQFLAPI